MSADMYAITTLADGQRSWRGISSEADLLPGETLSNGMPKPMLNDLATELMSNVQAWMDVTASGNGYDSIASCISYKDSSIAQWSADAKAAIAWRDAVWSACFQWQEAAKINPPVTFPTSDEVIAQLPQPASFGWVSHQAGQS